MGKITSLEKPQSNISEAYRTIRTGIEFSNLDKNLKVICVTSSKKDEGKTTVLCNLGVNFAKIDKKVLLIDGDLRNPTVNKLFDTKNAQGLMDILLGRKNIEECIKKNCGKNLESIVLFDIYRGAQIEQGKKSVAFSLTLRSKDHTLTDKEADSAQKKALNALKTNFNAILRS